jgi:PIN domain nuclease of toxin-antitoxin system
MSSSRESNNTEIEKLVMDTHALIWYLEGIELSEQQVKIIEQHRQLNQLYISAISIWEVTMLINKKKTAISISINEWLHKVLAIPGLNIIDLTPGILMESCNLPNYDHRDPADRMIIASTREIDGHLLTFDRKILDYAENGYLKVC